MSDLSPARVKADLEGILTAAERSVIALEATLTDERNALAERDLPALERTSTTKRTLINSIEQLESSRAGLCRAANLSSDAADMPTMLTWCAADTDLADRWQRILALGVACDKSNLANGAIIRLRQQQVADGLQVLKGSAADSATYGPTGAATLAAAGGRSLTAA